MENAEGFVLYIFWLPLFVCRNHPWFLMSGAAVPGVPRVISFGLLVFSSSRLKFLLNKLEASITACATSRTVTFRSIAIRRVMTDEDDRETFGIV